MATPTVVSGSVTTNNSGGTSLTNLNTTYTVNSGIVSNMLIVLVQSPQSANATSCTWIGVPMTPIVSNANEFWDTAFFMLNPPVASGNVIGVNWSTICNYPVITILQVQNAGGIGIVGSATNSDNHAVVDLTTTQANSLLIDFCMSNAASHTQDGAQVQLSNLLSSNSSYRQSTSSLGTTTIGIYQMGVVLGSAQNWDIRAFEVIPPVSFIPQVLII